LTIALAINVGDSLVLASDSALTQSLPGAAGALPQAINIWNSGNKIFNLRKGLPIGLMFWGQATIDGFSMSTLAKDLRCKLSGQDASAPDWTIEPDSYKIRDVAERVQEFFYGDRATKPQGPLGLLVGGYSAGSGLAEWYQISINPGDCSDPIELAPPGAAAAAWFGQPEAVARLVTGVSENLPLALANLGVPATDVKQYVEEIQNQVAQPIVWPGMPIGEVIDLAQFLVETTIRFVRFMPGNPTVGGPIEIAALTRHEGFKWVMRKHHYPASLNPEESQ
jgi:hypothetical protein